MDGLMGRYHIRAKTTNIMTRLFYHFIDMAATNAYILYHRIAAQKKLHPDYLQLEKEKLLELPEFRCELAEGLVAWSAKKPTGRPSMALARAGTATPPPRVPTPPVSAVGKNTIHPVADIRYDGYQHDLLWFRKDQTKKLCALCKKSQTKAYCSKCNVSLCCSTDKNCFWDYHHKLTA